MGKGPVLRFWTHWSQSCCWRKAQTRFHSQGTCPCECERKSTTFLYFYRMLTLTFASLWPDMTHHCGDDAISFGSTSLPPHHCWHSDPYTSVTSYPPAPNDRPASAPFTSISHRVYSTPPPYSSRLQSKLLKSMCHKTVNSLFRVIICETLKWGRGMSIVLYNCELKDSLFEEIDCLAFVS